MDLPTLYYYCSVHSGMGGQADTNSTAGASNFDGSIQATRPSKPFGWVFYCDLDGKQQPAGTVGHGLGAKPEFIQRF